MKIWYMYCIIRNARGGQGFYDDIRFSLRKTVKNSGIREKKGSKIEYLAYRQYSEFQSLLQPHVK